MAKNHCTEEECRKYEGLHSGDVFRVEKNFIKALEYMEVKLLDKGYKK